jgi:hypothetical protein
MATQYTTILKLALPTQGELSGTWGDVVNENITSMVEEAIAGRAVINTWTTNSHTLTTANGLTSESRCAMLEFTDSGAALTGAGTVICPTQPKIYLCKNSTGQIITIRTSAGTGVAVQNGQAKFVFCDGTNVVEAVTSMTTLKVGTGVQVNTILDEDNMASDSATALATQQSIKAYVDSQVTAQDLDFAGGSGTGAVDLDSQTFTIAGTANEIETAASGQTLTVGLPAAIIVTTSVTTPTAQVTNLNANDGTTAATIANSTGVMTINSAVLTTADINGGTADNVAIGSATPSTGAFTTVTATGNITSQGQVITNTINEQTATSGVTVDGVLLKDGGATFTADITIPDKIVHSGDTNTSIRFPAADTVTVETAGVERLRVDSSGNVGIGTSSPAQMLHLSGTIPDIQYTDTTGNEWRVGNNNGVFRFYDVTAAAERMRIDASGNVGIGTNSPGSPLEVSFSNSSVYSSATDTDYAASLTIGNTSDTEGSYSALKLLSQNAGGVTGFWSIASVSTSSNYDNHLVFHQRTGSATYAERARIDSSGNFFVGATELSTTSTTDTGGSITANGAASFLRASNTPLNVMRQTNDGTLVDLRQGGTSEGTISVSGTTVSYNGGHLSRWAQFPDNSRPELLKGTVMSNLDQMSNWDNEDNEQLNCVQVSAVEGDANVAGVFVAWDSTDDGYNDILLAMTGDMVIRIGAGTTVQRGDLLMSAGDGTAKPQGDDIVRSKTIAKVTSTHVSHTYADGSYAVPCVLMAC